ncbi:MAG TPA: hypothetical protein VGF59_36170 [Bryobacteraceae bacterium]|jgi:hypothetical protein
MAGLPDAAPGVLKFGARLYLRNASRIHSMRGGETSSTLTTSNRVRSQFAPARRTISRRPLHAILLFGIHRAIARPDSRALTQHW